MATSIRTILVVGATGQQGSAVLSELSYLASSTSTSSPSTAFPALKILALTRRASSVKAQSLLSTYGKTLNLEVVEGDTRDPGPIFAAHKNISAIFAYTTPPAHQEEAQATALVDAAASSGVQHFVFSSVDRGGDERSWENPTDVPHFASKHNIEHHLRKVCATHPSMTYTILRPVAFMDNLNPTSAFGAVMAGIWATMPSTTKLQLISVRDIGVFGAKALLHPDAYANRAISLAGDSLTLPEARAIYRNVSGSQLPQAWSIVGHGVRWGIKEVGTMFAWFEREGYGVDVQKLRAEEPRLQDFETWLKESSKFECGKGKK
ncbi:nucleoside-diphosphate-sugar epimerase family protein [Xylariaceae sp. FL1651]|nr:nucleoside-diphosphate-sugar epimerase family protein [Xylariaceae sp. FL1651]